jgi:hypothetical protein
MTQWTSPAAAELTRYCERQRDQLVAAGADPADVLDDLRRHITEEAARAGITVLTREDVVRLLSGMQDAAAGSDPLPPAVPGPRAQATAHFSGLALFACLAFGVALPLFAWLFELLTGVCTTELFDPLPTLWHVVLVACVPPANLLACLALQRDQIRRWRLLAWSNSIALGISLYYALGFLPFTPFALVGIVMCGLGLLPLAPLLALLTGFSLRKRLRQRAAAAGVRLRGAWCGLLIGMLALLALDVPKAVTLAGMQMAVSEHDATQARGIQVLRVAGNQAELLRACYLQRRFAIDLLTLLFRISGPDVTAAQAQDVYYRVTGVPYNAVAPPVISGPRTRMANVEHFDYDQGGAAVAARLRGLSLDQSRLDGTIDPDAATAYLEWTMVFRNNAAVQHEARAQVVLPPDAVVSRVTLWVNDTPREAAFAPRAQARKAYEDIVQQRRDPILVTTSGRDQVLVQCFPVPPHNGTMKVRIGITVPLTLPTLAEGLVRLPFFSERNFAPRAGLEHGLWLEAPTAVQLLQPMTSMVCAARDSAWVLRGNLGAAALDQIQAVRVARNPLRTDAWAWLDAASNTIVRQHISATNAVPPQRIVLVLDQSRRMAAYTNMVNQALRALPSGVEVALLAAGDTVRELLPPTWWTPAAQAQATAALAALTYVGGCDNAPALTRAWDLAAARAPSLVVWLHATQPLQARTSEALRQRLARQPWSPVILDLQCGTGPNALAAQLNGLVALQSAVRFGEPAHDLERLVAQWQPAAAAVGVQRWCENPGSNTAGLCADAQLARLWANDHVQTLCGQRRASATSNAVAVAMAQHVVTPVSGAVVLETDAQFQAAGLTPVSDDLVPRVVPEPCLTGLLMLALILRMRRRHGAQP